MPAASTDLLTAIIQDNISPDAWAWLGAQGDINQTAPFNAAFAMMPRKTGKAVIKLSSAQKEELNTAYPGLSFDNWTIDRLSRVWLLAQADAASEDKYFSTIENLFQAAEMNELVALYSALPLLAHPQLWVKRCAEGIRSNIGTVLEAIMYHNPYPAQNLNEAAWNQMVLKAFFTEKDIEQISGTDERANAELSRILIDYAKERRAAGRTVDPLLWELAGKFADGDSIAQLKQGV